VLGSIVLLSIALSAQTKRLWVLRPGEMVEYDPATFAVKQTVKLPAEVAQSPLNISVNHLGQILYVPTVALPLSESDLDAPHKAWFWNGHAGATLDLGLKRELAETGSNQAVTETAPSPELAADGSHLFWFANSAHRLQREEQDLSTVTTWQAWITDLSGSSREDLVSEKLPDCRCTTGSCEETCPYGVIWAPEDGIDKFFLLTQFVSGKDTPAYKSSTRYQAEAGKWSANPLADPLHHVLDATSSGDVIVEAIPDTGCCGWANQSDDQTVVRMAGGKRIVFDEQVTYKNPDYDVSFFTANARLSPDISSVAMTITATAKVSQPIQISEQGQANPEESKQIRKSLADLPAVEVKTLVDPPKRVALVPHATLVGWINQKELLLVEDRLLVIYNVATSTTRKSAVRVEDATRVLLR